MTKTEALSEFLLARIAEDEAAVEGFHQGSGDPDFFWGPARIRAECEAKRRIVERANAMGLARRWSLLVPLAAVYAGHPDHRYEWRP